MNTETTPRNNTEPVLIPLSVLAFLQLLFAGAGLSDIIGVKAVLLGVLLVGAAQGGIGFWVRGQVTATANVVAYVNPANEVVSGPALLAVDDGKPIAVTPLDVPTVPGASDPSTPTG